MIADPSEIAHWRVLDGTVELIDVVTRFDGHNR